ncbi:MAG: phytanoyl-CoA dioxygenase family protein [Reyranella sp.]|nr:phytanoyl-CoA dioxygenase family protein [Reyranella sp.]
MPKILTGMQVDQYRGEGFVFPVPVLTNDEVRELRADLEHWERQQGHPLDFPEKSKSYLLYKWADTLVHHPKVLDAVEDVIGPDILVYHSTMWIKEALTPAYVRWHQDGAYFFLDPLEHVTAWVALSEASERAGCMRVIPGTHRLPMIEHDDKPDAHNMIKRGQGISERFDGERGTSMPLHAGELSLHHTALVHCSPGNEADDRRMGLGISFVPAHVRPLGPVKPSALLVRGVDRHGHFLPEKRLVTPMSDEARAAHAEAVRLFRARQDQGFEKVAERLTEL